MKFRAPSATIAPHLLLTAYVFTNAAALYGVLLMDSPTASAKSRFEVASYGLTGPGYGVLLLVGSLLFLQVPVRGRRTRMLLAVSTCLGLGQVLLTVYGLVAFDWTGRVAGRFAAQLAFLLACALVAVVAWQPGRSVPSNDSSTDSRLDSSQERP